MLTSIEPGGGPARGEQPPINPSSSMSVARMLLSPDTETRELAAKTICKRGLSAEDPSIIPTLLEALIRDASPVVRADLAKTLGSAVSHKETVLGTLIYSLQDRDETVRIAALQSLEQQRPNPNIAPILFYLYENSRSSKDFKSKLGPFIDRLCPSWAKSEERKNLIATRAFEDGPIKLLNKANQLDPAAPQMTEEEAFKILLCGALIDTTAGVNNNRAAELAGAALGNLAQYATTPEAQTLTALLSMLHCGYPDQDLAPVAVRTLRDLDFDHNCVVAIGLNLALGTELGNLVRERILGELTDLCHAASQPQEAGVLVENLCTWLTPQLYPYRDTLDKHSLFNTSARNREFVRDVAGTYSIVPDYSQEALERNVRLESTLAISPLALKCPSTFPSARQTLMELSTDLDPRIREAAYIGIGHLAPHITFDVMALQKNIKKEREFKVQCAAVWCLKQLLDASQIQAKAPAPESLDTLRSLNRFILRAIPHERVDHSGFPRNLALLHLLTEQEALGLAVKTAEHVNEAISFVSNYGSRFPMLPTQVGIAALNQLPHMTRNNPDQAVITLFELFSYQWTTYSTSDKALRAANYRVLRGMDLELSQAIAKSDSIRASTNAFCAIQDPSIALRVTLDAEKRPHAEQHTLLRELVLATFRMNRVPMLSAILADGAEHFGEQDSSFSRTWKTSLIKTIHEALDTDYLLRSIPPADRKLLCSSLGLYRKVEDPELRTLVRQFIWKVGGISGAIDVYLSRAKSLHRDDPKKEPATPQPSSPNQILRDTLRLTADPMREVRAHAANMLLEKVPGSGEKTRVLNMLLAETDSIRVKSLLASFESRE